MIVQVGPYPDPIGGISIYIKRMKNYLDISGFENEVWDISGIEKNVYNVKNMRLKFIPLYYYFNKEINMIHYHICGKRTKKYIGFFNKLIFRKRKKLLTIHGECINLFKQEDKSLIKALNTFDVIICVKPGDKDYLISKGIYTKLHEVPAFIFPSEKTLKNEIPIEVNKFIKKHKFIICANASAIRFYNNEDLYGIDMCIKLMIKLKKIQNDKKIGLIFCLPNINDLEYFKKMNNIIEENNLGKDFLFINKKIDLYPIIKRSHVFLRPTNTDGDAISIRESLYYTVPTIASDVVKRPKGTILFKTRDIDDLYNKTSNLIVNYDEHKERIKNIKCEDNAKKIIEIYKKL